MLNLNYLNFSDGAKYADIARNFVGGHEFVTSFNFWGGNNILGISPFMPFFVSIFFKVFGIRDFTVILTSLFFFLLTLLFTFLLSKNIFKTNLIATLSTVCVGLNYDLINYATNGASESPFIFEIVAATYLVSLRKTWGNMVAIFLFVAMYFTRPQAFIYIAGIILYYLLLNFKTQKAILYFIIVSVAGFLVDRFLLTPLSGKYFLYSVLGRGSDVLSQVGVGQSASDQLRSGVLTYNFSIIESLKKIFYNLYNFYKLLPQIINPYLFTLFVIGLFRKGNMELKTVAGFIVLTTLFVAAASIPFYRYIHPIIPFVYIIAVATLAEIVTNKKALIFLVLIFAVGQTFGIIFLDSRFEKQNHNIGKPPVYVVLSQILKTNTSPNDVVVTNLDTWGSWYGERKTVWFPIEPKQLIDQTTGKIPFDAIYLTSYLIDDQNYYMNNDWRQIFNNPTDSKKWTCDGCNEIAKEFTLKGVYTINSSDDYERQDSKAVLLVRK